MRMVEDGNQFKPLDRLREKKAEEQLAKPGRSAGDIAGGIPDRLRRTVYGDSGDYVGMYNSVMASLEDRGYHGAIVRNWWGSPYYNGITVIWRNPDDDLMELQLHTEESLAARRLTDAAYRRQRNPGTSPQERQDLLAYVAHVAGYVPIPPGARDIKSHANWEGTRPPHSPDQVQYFAIIDVLSGRDGVAGLARRRWPPAGAHGVYDETLTPAGTWRATGLLAGWDRAESSDHFAAVTSDVAGYIQRKLLPDWKSQGHG